jgi:hypothetical protein
MGFVTAGRMPADAIRDGRLDPRPPPQADRHLTPRRERSPSARRADSRRERTQGDFLRHILDMSTIRTDKASVARTEKPRSESAAPANSIQAAIKQTRPFRSRRQEALVGLMLTAEAVKWPMQDLLAAHEDLTLQQYNVLRILRGAGASGLPTLEIGARPDRAHAWGHAADRPDGTEGAWSFVNAHATTGASSSAASRRPASAC